MKLEEFTSKLSNFGFTISNMNIPYSKIDSRCWSISVSRGNDVCVVTYFQNRGDIGNNSFDIMHERVQTHIPIVDIFETIDSLLK